MQDNGYYRQPQPFSGGMPGGFFGQFFGFPQMPPFGQLPGGQTSGTGSPSGPPPSFVPPQTAVQQTIGIYAIDPGAIRPCTFRFVYLWLDNGQQFWAWLVFVGSRSAAGWRWIGYRWVYFGIDLDRIESFVCY